MACSLAFHSNVLKWFTYISRDRSPISDYLFLVIRISTGSSVTQHKHYPTTVLRGAVHAAVTPLPADVLTNTLQPHQRTCSCFFAWGRGLSDWGWGGPWRPWLLRSLSPAWAPPRETAGTLGAEQKRESWRNHAMRRWLPLYDGYEATARTGLA